MMFQPRHTSIGFTGSSTVVTPAQGHALKALLRLFRSAPPNEAHHGDCIKGDAVFHEAVREVLPATKIHIHPPKDAKKRAWKVGNAVWPEKDYLVRDDDIASSIDYLFACPSQRAEVVRSGVWATIRYARKYRVYVTIIPPDGIAYSEWRAK